MIALFSLAIIVATIIVLFGAAPASKDSKKDASPYGGLDDILNDIKRRNKK